MPPHSIFLVRPTMAAGGADRVTLTLLRELDRDLFSPTLVLMRREGPLLPGVPTDVPICSLDGHSLWTAWWLLARLLRRQQPEILFSTSSGANVMAALASLLTPGRRRLVLSERSILARRTRLKSIVMTRLKRWLYPRADCITAVSLGVKRDLLRRLRLPEERVQVVYNPVLTADLTGRAAEAPSHPWFAEAPPVVLAAGRQVAAKGFDCLLDAFARIRRHREARLLILGEGPLRPDLEAQITHLDLEDRVSLPGFDPNPLACMARCTLFVLSSRREGLPGALIQAMACGAPAIATDCSAGPAEIISHGDSGLLVPVDDPAVLAASIEQLLGNPGARAAMALRGRQAVQRFAVEAVLPAYTRALLGDEPSP